MILKPLIVGEMNVFCYLIGCPETGEAAAVDPAGDTDRILAEARQAGLTIRRIINTHGHPDHTAGNAALKAATGAEIVLHRDDDDLYNSPAGQEIAVSWGFAPSPPADVRLEGDTRIAVGRLELTVWHTPGHSPGSICLLAPGLVFTGDTLFVGSAGRTDLPGGSLPRLLGSISRLVTLPDDTVVCPGHDYGDTPTSTIGREKKTNVYVVEFDLLEN